MEGTVERPATPGWRNRAVMLWGGALGQLALGAGVLGALDGRPRAVAANAFFGAFLLAFLARRQHRLDHTQLRGADLPWVLGYAALMVAAVLAGVALL